MAFPNTWGSSFSPNNSSNNIKPVSSNNIRPSASSPSSCSAIILYKEGISWVEQAKEYIRHKELQDSLEKFKIEKSPTSRSTVSLWPCHITPLPLPRNNVSLLQLCYTPPPEKFVHTIELWVTCVKVKAGQKLLTDEIIQLMLEAKRQEQVFIIKFWIKENTPTYPAPVWNKDMTKLVQKYLNE